MTPKLVPALFAAAFLAASCRQLADIEERPACEGGAATACAACQRSSCCDALADCRADPRCASAEACVAECAAGGHECRAKCRQDHLDGFRERFAALAACSAAACAETCEAAWGLAYPSQACGECAAKCDGEQGACGGSADCLAVAFCSWPCGDALCRGTCERQNPDGIDAARDLGECLTRECWADCAHAARLDWTCLQLPPPEVGAGADVTVAIDVRLWGTNMPADGKHVRACHPTSDLPACVALPLAEGWTSGGKLSLEVPFGFDGYFFVEEANDSFASIRYLELPATNPDTHIINLIPSTTPLQLPLVGSIDVTLGMLTFTAYDCARAQPAGVSFILDGWGADTKPFYGNTGQVAGTATVATPVVDQANGGYLNVPEGFVEVTAVRRDTLGCVFRKKVISRGGALTSVPMRPVGSCAKP